MAKTPAKPNLPPPLPKTDDTSAPATTDDVSPPVSGDPTLPADIAAAVAAGLALDNEQQQIYDDYEQACARLAAGVS